MSGKLLNGLLKTCRQIILTYCFCTGLLQITTMHGVNWKNSMKRVNYGLSVCQILNRHSLLIWLHITGLCLQSTRSKQIVVKRIRHRYFNITDRKLSSVAVTLKLSMMSRLSSFRERRKRLCFRKRSSSLSSSKSSVKSISVTDWCKSPEYST